MLRFVGCDVHKRMAVFSILLQDGKLLATYTIAVTREALAAFAQQQLRAEDRLVMEATTNTWAVAEVLRPYVQEIVIGNPLRVRAIAEAKIKTDKVDSRVLAELLRADYLPAVWQPDNETLRLRRLTHRRKSGAALEEFRFASRDNSSPRINVRGIVRIAENKVQSPRYSDE